MNMGRKGRNSTHLGYNPAVLRISFVKPPRFAACFWPREVAAGPGFMFPCLLIPFVLSIFATSTKALLGIFVIGRPEAVKTVKKAMIIQELGVYAWSGVRHCGSFSSLP